MKRILAGMISVVLGVAPAVAHSAASVRLSNGGIPLANGASPMRWEGGSRVFLGRGDPSARPSQHIQSDRVLSPADRVIGIAPVQSATPIESFGGNRADRVIGQFLRPSNSDGGSVNVASSAEQAKRVSVDLDWWKDTGYEVSVAAPARARATPPSLGKWDRAAQRSPTAARTPVRRLRARAGVISGGVRTFAHWAIALLISSAMLFGVSCGVGGGNPKNTPEAKASAVTFSDGSVQNISGSVQEPGDYIETGLLYLPTPGTFSMEYGGPSSIAIALTVRDSADTVYGDPVDGHQGPLYSSVQVPSGYFYANARVRDNTDYISREIYNANTGRTETEKEYATKAITLTVRFQATR